MPMPTSNPNIIPHIVNSIVKLQPKSILDVGCGFGAYGYLLRQYLDVAQKRYTKKDWKIKIDAVEIFPKYITPLQKLIYNNIFLNDIVKAAPRISRKYDVILALGVIEHLKKKDGYKVLEILKDKTKKQLYISTPKFFRHQGAFLGNENERHVSLWTEHDFRGSKTLINDGRVLLIRYGEAG
jgi:2-polyprenyl-3-methyl-5-hydroxy-6-metoxy-1,4-benzoquinol methylase